MKIKKENLRVLYCSVISVAITFLLLTDIEWRRIVGIALGVCFLSYFLFDKRVEKRHF